MIGTAPIRPFLDARSLPPAQRRALQQTRPSLKPTTARTCRHRDPPWQICSSRTSGLGIDARRCQA